MRRCEDGSVGGTDLAVGGSLLVLTHDVVGAGEDHTADALALGLEEDVEGVGHGEGGLA